MEICKEYYLAKTIPEAMQALTDVKGSVRLIAGGTDLLLDLQQGRCAPVHTLVDITRIEELQRLELCGNELFIGAAIPLAQLSASPLVQQHAQALVQACDLVGGPQVRNMATLGGNVAHALPAADGSIALVALDAQAEVAGIHNCYRIPLADLFLAPGKSNLTERRELLIGFYIQLAHPGEASAFQRVMRPQGVALPILNMAIWLHRQQEIIVDLRIAIGPAGQVPCRALAVENALRGKVFTSTLIQTGGEILASSVHYRTSPYRATSAYRQHLAGILFHQLMSKVWNLAGRTLNG